MMNAKEVGRVITELRKQEGLTQRKLADMVGVTDKAVSKWERGVGCPDISLLPKLSIIFDTDIESLLRGEFSYHSKNWKGVLYIPHNKETNASTIIYDKPIVDYLISNFLLVGIRNIFIIACGNDLEFIKNKFIDGKSLGVNIKYKISEEYFKETYERRKIFSDNDNIFAIYGNYFVYGLNLTRIYQNYMMSNEYATFVRTYSDENMPFLFCTGKAFNEINIGFNTLYIKKNEKNKIKKLGRGIITIPLDTFENALQVSQLVHIVKITQGLNICDINEIALNRGLIAESIDS